MADQYESEDETDFETGDSLVKDLRKQLNAATKRAKELEQELTTIKTVETERSVAEILTARNINPRVAKYLLADGIEGSEAIDAWLTENAEVFGFTPSAPGEDTAPTPGNTLNPESIAETKRLQSLGQAASTPTSLTDYKADMAKATTPKEISEVFKKYQQAIL